jgi:quercetin dioxygenase-like cupin family protein
MGRAEAALFHEDDRVRVTRWSFASAGDTTGEHEHEYGYIVVPVTGGDLRVVSADGTSGRMEQRAGQPYAGTASTHHTVISEGDRPIVFVEIEFKSVTSS